jgi:hypothetical protein
VDLGDVTAGKLDHRRFPIVRFERLDEHGRAAAVAFASSEYSTIVAAAVSGVTRRERALGAYP